MKIHVTDSQRRRLARLIAELYEDYVGLVAGGQGWLVDARTGAGRWGTDLRPTERVGDASDFIRAHPARIALIAILRAETAARALA